MTLRVEKNVDILRYSANTRTIDGEIDKDWQKVFDRQGEPKVGSAAILKQLFLEHAYPFSIICTCYKTQLLKRMITYAKREYLVVPEDAYQQFLIASLAESYKGVRTRPFYQYRVGSGVSTGQSTLPKFHQFALGMKILQWLREFSADYAKNIELTNACIDALENSLTESLATKFRALPEQEKPEAFALLADSAVNLVLFYQKLQALGPSNKELYCVPTVRLFRALIKSLIGKSQ